MAARFPSASTEKPRGFSPHGIVARNPFVGIERVAASAAYLARDA
jgi:hypothetical protein